MNQIIEQTVSNPKCDASIKKLFGDPYIIAILNKLTFPEIYGSYSIQEIKNQYVIDEINIGEISVDQDEVLKLNSEDTSLDESTISYDVLTLLKTPEDKGFFLDVEGQVNTNPGYHLINRGLYYVGRLLSRQKNLIWFQSDYDGLVKVISLWICIEPTQKAENTIQRIKLNYEDTVGTLKEEKEVYDKAEIIMVQLGKEAYLHENALIRFLGTLMTSKLSAKEKIEYLRNEFQIEDNETRERVSGMCNLSIGYYNEGYSEGRTSGFSEGKEAGINETIIDMIQNYAVKKGVSIDQSMEDHSIPEDKWDYYAYQCEMKYGKIH